MIQLGTLAVGFLVAHTYYTVGILSAQDLHFRIRNPISIPVRPRAVSITLNEARPRSSVCFEHTTTFTTVTERHTRPRRGGNVLETSTARVRLSEATIGQAGLRKRRWDAHVRAGWQRCSPRPRHVAPVHARNQIASGLVVSPTTAAGRPAKRGHAIGLGRQNRGSV